MPAPIFGNCCAALVAATLATAGARCQRRLGSVRYAGDGPAEELSCRFRRFVGRVDLVVTHFARSVPEIPSSSAHRISCKLYPFRIQFDHTKK